MIPKFEKEKHEFVLWTRPNILGFLDQFVGLLFFLHILSTGFLQKLDFKDADKATSM